MGLLSLEKRTSSLPLYYSMSVEFTTARSSILLPEVLLSIDSILLLEILLFIVSILLLEILLFFSLQYIHWLQWKVSTDITNYTTNLENVNTIPVAI